MIRCLLVSMLSCTLFFGYGQRINTYNANKWVDSVFSTMTPEQKIAQLMVVRVSSIDGASRRVTFYEKEVEDAIRTYGVGSICLFQGGPLKQASMINRFQSISRVPLLVTIDAENGVGMRFDSVAGLPRMMMLGAVQDPNLVYQYGRVVGEQCSRIGIHLNYAPVVDVNNNPQNPVINDRSFGEDKHKVALYGLLYMKGMQEMNVMASAKHFPGHGNVDVDSHYDLPVINKSRKELDSLELYPFRSLIEGGVGSVMVAHLNIPSIDASENRASSVSKKIIDNLLKKELGFKGLVVSDALEMKGVTKFFGKGELSAEALIAGNDLLCLPEDIPSSIEEIKKAIHKKKISWKEVDARVKKLLHAKFRHGLASIKTISLENLTEDLNKDVPEMRRKVAESAITLLSNKDAGLFPLKKGKRVAYVGFGLNRDNAFAEKVRKDYDAHVYYFDYKLDSSKAQATLDIMRNRYDVVIIGMHAYSRFPANDFGLSKSALDLLERLQKEHRTISMVFGNPYLLKYFCNSSVLIACYEDDSYTQEVASDLLAGQFHAQGKLPVTVCPNYPAGSGIVEDRLMTEVRASELGFNESKLLRIDSIMEDAIQKKAIPGGVVLVARNGKIAYHKAFGTQAHDNDEPVYEETIYDLASVTKIMATTAAVMKLYDEKRLNIDATLGQYLPEVRGTNKENILVRDLLLHQAGLRSWIPFYRETVDTLRKNTPNLSIYSFRPDPEFPIRVAQHMYMRRDWLDTINNRIMTSPLSKRGNYIYSDLDFIFLGRIVEAITGTPLDKYVELNFFLPLGMTNTAFKPREKFPVDNIAPTEREEGFRQQLLQGDVHDPGAAMFGGVAGHAGLFSNAYDLAVMSQMLLQKGQFNGRRYFSDTTMDVFNRYYTDTRRGLGFDKPERDNATRDEPYPTKSASSATFGHTGFTGTCLWVDPEQQLIFILLANRVNNNGDANRFGRMNIRPKVHETIYEAMRK